VLLARPLLSQYGFGFVRRFLVLSRTGASSRRLQLQPWFLRRQSQGEGLLIVGQCSLKRLSFGLDLAAPLVGAHEEPAHFFVAGTGTPRLKRLDRLLHPCKFLIQFLLNGG